MRRKMNIRMLGRNLALALLVFGMSSAAYAEAVTDGSSVTAAETVQAVEPAQTVQTEKQADPKVTVKKKGKVYYLRYAETGKVVKGSKKYSIVEFNDTYYAVNNKGQLKVNCWFYKGSALYRAKKNGTLYTSGTYDGITFTSSAKAEVNSASKLRIYTLKIVAKITKPGMSKKQKLRACWNYMVKRSRWRYRGYRRGINADSSGQDGWWYDAALFMFQTNSGSCFNWSAAFAALAREIGYDPYIYNGLRYKISKKTGKVVNTRHSWVKIGKLYYDPQMEWSHKSGCYAKKEYTLSQKTFKYRKIFKFRFAGKK